MPYALQTDIVTLYGRNALVVADHDGSGTVDGLSVDRALDLASAEIDSYLAVRYRLPLHEVPAVLVQYCVDFAVYRLALSADVLSDEHRRRYEDGLKALKEIAAGRATLVFLTPVPVDPNTDPTVASGPRPIVSGGPPRIFTRADMRDL